MAFVTGLISSDIEPDFNFIEFVLEALFVNDDNGTDYWLPEDKIVLVVFSICGWFNLILLKKKWHH